MRRQPPEREKGEGVEEKEEGEEEERREGGEERRKLRKGRKRRLPVGKPELPPAAIRESAAAARLRHLPAVSLAAPLFLLTASSCDRPSSR